jgi:hypothetical protein
LKPNASSPFRAKGSNWACSTGRRIESCSAQDRNEKVLHGASCPARIDRSVSAMDRSTVALVANEYGSPNAVPGVGGWRRAMTSFNVFSVFSLFSAV